MLIFIRSTTCDKVIQIKNIKKDVSKSNEKYKKKNTTKKENKLQKERERAREGKIRPQIRDKT